MPTEHTEAPTPLMVFYSYAHEDERLRSKLEKHLSLLRRQGLITQWHDRQIMPGAQWSETIDEHLETASIILLLISPDFLASDYCYGVEMQRALARHAKGEAQVIPILLRPVDWERAPFAGLQCLPHDGRAITQWTNQDEALVTLAKGIRTVIEQVCSPVTPHPSPASLTHHTSSVLKLPAQPHAASGDRNRQRMLERVRRTWIVGVLEHSLHDAARIALGLREEPEVLANPWRLVVQEIDHPAQPLPAGTRITEVYDEADGALLILGEPGAGKTTLLLELARDLLVRAQADEREPIPVVFNLSSWAQKRAPLADWLVEELYLRYQVPRTLGQTWVDNDQLLLLLDGLDEVAATQRSACVRAINSYLQVHPLVPMVVCSRRADYLNQAQQLGLQRAVVVQPLTPQQIDDYLANAGKQVAALRVALCDDPVLQEMATTPLMLNILILAHQDVPLERRGDGSSTEAQREQLFASYVQHMLKRRYAEMRYTPEQTTRWLSQLAGQMKQQSQSIFYLEQMQPNWLSGNRVLGVYDWLAVRLPGVLIGILVSLSINLSFMPPNSPELYSFIESIFLGGFLGGLLSGGSPTRRLTTNSGKERGIRWLRLLQWLLTGVLVGLGAGLTYGLSFGRSFGLIYGLTIGVCSILLQAFLEKNKTTETLPSPSTRETKPQGLFTRRVVRNGLLIGLLVGLSFGLKSGLVSWPNPLLNEGLGDGVRYGLSYGLIGGPLQPHLFWRRGGRERWGLSGFYITSDTIGNVQQCALSDLW